MRLLLTFTNLRFLYNLIIIQLKNQNSESKFKCCFIQYQPQKNDCETREVENTAIITTRCTKMLESFINYMYNNIHWQM